MSNDKPRLVKLHNEYEIERLVADRGNIGVPYVVTDHGGSYADADELRVWRASQSTSTGGE
jgi:hypothetical protein